MALPPNSPGRRLHDGRHIFVGAVDGHGATVDEHQYDGFAGLVHRFQEIQLFSGQFQGGAEWLSPMVDGSSPSTSTARSAVLAMATAVSIISFSLPCGGSYISSRSGQLSGFISHPFLYFMLALSPTFSCNPPQHADNIYIVRAVTGSWNVSPLWRWDRSPGLILVSFCQAAESDLHFSAVPWLPVRSLSVQLPACAFERTVSSASSPDLPLYGASKSPRSIFTLQDISFTLLVDGLHSEIFPAAHQLRVTGSTVHLGRRKVGADVQAGIPLHSFHARLS